MKVLIAVEDKVYGEAIAHFVANHKWAKNTAFKVIHVQNDDDYYGFATDPYCCEHSKDLAQEHKRKARALVLDVATKIQVALPGMRVEEQVLQGRPRELILQTTKEWKADLLILGSHGRTGFNRFLLGSVSLAVLAEAPCSVMIVRLPKEQEQRIKEMQQAAKKQPSNQEIKPEETATTTKVTV